MTRTGSWSTTASPYVLPDHSVIPAKAGIPVFWRLVGQDELSRASPGFSSRRRTLASANGDSRFRGNDPVEGPSGAVAALKRFDRINAR